MNRPGTLPGCIVVPVNKKKQAETKKVMEKKFHTGNRKLHRFIIFYIQTVGLYWINWIELVC